MAPPLVGVGRVVAAALVGLARENMRGKNSYRKKTQKRGFKRHTHTRARAKCEEMDIVLLCSDHKRDSGIR